MIAKSVRVVLILLVLLAHGTGSPLRASAVSGPCSDCHTMHYSQGGTVLAAWEGGPNPKLLNKDCIGCHSGGSSTVDLYGTPMVGHSSVPTGTLAAGSFYWVSAGEDTKGHNVAGIAPEDASLSAPPGFGGGESAPDGSTPGSDWTGQLGCAGTYGCHGTHATADPFDALAGAHHNNKTGDVPAGAPPGEGFRFLQGVKGKEDPDWEKTVANGTSDHNQYYGVHGTADNQTISAFCARCHGNFHGTGGELRDGSGAWIRHPVDYDLGATDAGSEYKGYNGATDAAVAPYSILAPVASTDTSAALSTVNISSQAGEGIVTCLSCHRAHGSPYYKMMRWDYAGSPFGAGCSLCHSSKN